MPLFRETQKSHQLCEFNAEIYSKFNHLIKKMLLNIERAPIIQFHNI